MKFIPGIFLICSVLTITSCEHKGREVVPEGVIEVYDSAEGGGVIGASTTPIPVVGYVYPDKTRYVLKVCYLGHIGYVRDGIRELRPTVGRSSSCPETARSAD